MPLPYNNLVRVVGDSAAAMNAEIATQNAANYLLSAFDFDGAGNAALFFVQNIGVAYVATAPQKLNPVGSTQGDVNADVAAEAPGGYVPTGVTVNWSTGQMFVVYQQLNESSL